MTDAQRKLLTSVIDQQDPADDTSDILEACYDVVKPPEDTEEAMVLVGEMIELIDVWKAGA